jgi:hypothetical protein
MNYRTKWVDNALASPPPSQPTTSWWLDADRETWKQTVEKELPRLKSSKFGNAPGSGGDLVIKSEKGR